MLAIPVESNSFDDLIQKIADYNCLIHISSSNLICEREGIENLHRVLKKLMQETKKVKIIMVRHMEG